jgi:hypothetical protein
MELYSEEEKKNIETLRGINEKLEKFFDLERDKWEDRLKPLYDTVKLHMTRETAERIVFTQADALTIRQEITSLIAKFLEKRSKQEAKIKRLKQDKFVFYAIGTGLKTNTTEKSLLIEAHLAEEIRNMELIENYVEYLRAIGKNLESLQYTFKNIIELYTLLGAR